MRCKCGRVIVVPTWDTCDKCTKGKPLKKKKTCDVVRPKLTFEPTEHMLKTVSEGTRQRISSALLGRKRHYPIGVYKVKITHSEILLCEECGRKYLKPLGCIFCKHT